jgi:hypothetical protein
MPEKMRGSLSARFRVWLLLTRAEVKPPPIALQGLDFPRIVFEERLAIADDVQGGALLAAGLGDGELSGGKPEDRVNPAIPSRGIARLPFEPQAAGDHQVEQHGLTALEFESDPLADALAGDQALADQPIEGWVDAPQKGWRKDFGGVEARPTQLTLETFDVNADVRQFGHSPRRARTDREIQAEAVQAPIQAVQR